MPSISDLTQTSLLELAVAADKQTSPKQKKLEPKKPKPKPWPVAVSIFSVLDEKKDEIKKHEEMLQQVASESEQNRRFWKEEALSMNKWEKYGLSWPVLGQTTNSWV